MSRVISSTDFSPFGFALNGGLFLNKNRIFPTECSVGRIRIARGSVRCSEKTVQTKRTCKNCKGSFNPCVNHARACRFHTAHFGGETKRKFESVHTGGTMDTPDSGKVLQYWHCCGSEDPFDAGCTSGPHRTYDE